MSDLPPSTPSGTSASEGTPDDRLQQGLAALQQQNYAQAAHCLSNLSQDRAASGTVRLKARMGLVKALWGDGQTAAAIAIAQKLATHPQPKVQQWAINRLKQWLPSATPSSPSSSIRSPEDRSGFQPLAAQVPSSPPLASETPPKGNDLSGFQPLDDVGYQSSSQPLQSPHPTPSRRQDKAQPSATAAPGTISSLSASSGEGKATQSTSDDDVNETAPPTSHSLFHYEQLNRPPSPLAAAAAPSPTTAEAAEEDAIADSRDGPTAELLQFQYAGRLPRLRAVPQRHQELLQLWLILGVSAIALFWLCRALIQWLLSRLASFLELFDSLVSIPLAWRYQSHTFLVLFMLLGLLLASPWWLDWILKRTAGLTPLSIKELQKTHPEGCRLLRRISQQRDWLLPLLRELPTDVPLIFSYGWLPRYNRIVISRGLLNQLDDPELATLIGYELSHATRWLLPYMSLVTGLLQSLYQGYWQLAQWGNRRPDRVIKVAAATGSTICYTLYWLIRKLHVPLSKVRVLGGDRQTVEWTGNPNALMRALIKLEHGIAQSIADIGYTPPLLESTDLLTPCGYEAAITPGSIFPDLSFLDGLYWDIQNPYRRWFSINSSHPRLGERLNRLAGYAARWQLSAEIPFPMLSHAASRPAQVSFWDRWPAFLTQIAPYLGPFLGIAAALLLWFLGGIFEPLGLRQLGWVYGDRSVLWGSLLLGLGMGIMVRINTYFPDITPIRRRNAPPLPELLRDPLALPTDSQPVCLEGTLLGRRGMANWLCQDLILKTPTGLLKLHFLSILGAFGNLLIHPNHPTNWVGRSLAVQGWYRRGAIAWLDVEVFLTSGKAVAKANHPLWAVVLSLLFCGLGLLILFRG